MVNHAWLGAQIEQALDDGEAYGVRIAYSAEGEALETAGGIAYAAALLGDTPFLVVNGDIYCDFDVGRDSRPELVDHHAVNQNQSLLDKSVRFTARTNAAARH